MSRVGYNVVLKYCEVIDEFIKVRVFSEEDAHLLLKVDALPNKRAYQQLIVTSCIINYCDTVLPCIEARPDAGQPEIVEEFLYHLCVEVNPHLEIHNVVLPVEGDDAPPSDAELHLVGEPQAEPKQMRRFDRLPTDNLGDLRARLRRLVVGQDEAVDAVTRAVRKASVGLKPEQRPVGSFLFVGQTGIGKTELAKAVAKCVFGDAGHMIRIDCSEYGQPHEYAKLIGAPPGYVGHNEGGILTERAKKLGACVVLFDEIEKGHEKLHNLLLQLCDEGFVTDSHGTRIHFDECLILMTSNAGTRELSALEQRIGFERTEGAADRQAVEEETTRALKRLFRPEFINRLDRVIVFNALAPKECVRIVGKMLTDVGRLLKRSRIRARFDRKVKEQLVRDGYDPEYGARELRRIVGRRIEDPLTDLVLNGRARAGDTVDVHVVDGSIEMSISR